MLPAREEQSEDDVWFLLKAIVSFFKLDQKLSSSL